VNNTVDALRKRILVARREIPAHLVLKEGRVVNVFSGEVQVRDVAIYDGVIAGLGSAYQGHEEVSLNGKWIIPGLIDAHLHIESSMLLPSRLAAALLPHGTTTIIADPHEIGNVMGLEGVKFMLQESASAPLDIFFMAPSCIPATHLETTGARLGASDLMALKNETRILGLAEMMNFPGVLAGAQEVLEKLALFRDKIIDGHAPSVTGYDLQAYVAAGIRSDHETTDRTEGMEKLNSGMMIMVREGTSAKNLEDLLPLVTPENARRFCFVSDDLHPLEIRQRGHMNFIIRKAVDLGLNPVTAIQMATLNPAEYLGLKDRGAVAPGFQADIVVLADLEAFELDRVFKGGKLVVEGGELIDLPCTDDASVELRSMKVAPFTPESFRIPHEDRRARIIELIPGQILTRLRYEALKSENGWVKSDIQRDVLKLAVVERHRGTGNIGLGMVTGFGLHAGALASSVAHDSHNLIAVGVSDQEIWRSIEEVRVMGGGMAVISNGNVLARVPLEVAGLMSRKPLEELTKQWDEANRAVSSLGCTTPEPFMSLSFLALPVIPELKLTDMGLVDVRQFSLVPLFVDEDELRPI
jgi:adenine deaminase